MIQNNILELLSQDNFIMYNINIAHSIGIDEAILIGEMARKWNYWNKENKLDGDGSFYISQEDIESDTGLSPYRQRQALKKLKELGVVNVVLKGMPAVNHYQIFNNQLSNFLTTRCEEISQQDVKNFNTTKTGETKQEKKTGEKDCIATPSSSSKDTKEQRLAKAIKEDSKDIGAIFYYIDNLGKSTDFTEALKKWYNAVGKGLRIGQLQMRLEALYNLFPNEQQQIERINLCYEKSLPVFKFKTDTPNNSNEPGRIRTIDTSSQTEQIQKLQEIFGKR